jgi:hypothetical protein
MAVMTARKAHLQREREGGQQQHQQKAAGFSFIHFGLRIQGGANAQNQNYGFVV